MGGQTVRCTVFFYLSGTKDHVVVVVCILKLIIKKIEMMKKENDVWCFVEESELPI
jgi:hypothetical protein